MLYSRGNHDVDGVVKRRRFFSEHPVSTISPNGYFALTASGIRFVVLDTASPYDSRQKDWLECEVSSSDWINAKYVVFERNNFSFSHFYYVTQITRISLVSFTHTA